MPISAARKITYEALLRVESEGAYASDLLHAELGANIKPVDAALATELTLGVPAGAAFSISSSSASSRSPSPASTFPWPSRFASASISFAS